MMKPIFYLLMSLSLGIPSAMAHSSQKKGAGDEAHRKEDIAKHRAMAQAHEAAAKCLESGKAYEVCSADLRKACEGLGIGRYCGMKH